VVGADDSELRQLTVESSGGGEHAVAVLNGSGAARLANVTALAHGAAENQALSNSATETSLRSVHLRGEGGVGIGLGNRGAPGVVTVEGSIIGGTTVSVSNDSGHEVHVATSRLGGAIDNAGGGVFRCAAVYDDSFQSRTRVARPPVRV
jgi:hypothetical protein